MFGKVISFNQIYGGKVVAVNTESHCIVYSKIARSSRSDDLQPEGLRVVFDPALVRRFNYLAELARRIGIVYLHQFGAYKNLKHGLMAGDCNWGGSGLKPKERVVLLSFADDALEDYKLVEMGCCQVYANGNIYITGLTEHSDIQVWSAPIPLQLLGFSSGVMSICDADLIQALRFSNTELQRSANFA